MVLVFFFMTFGRGMGWAGAELLYSQLSLKFFRSF